MGVVRAVEEVVDVQCVGMVWTVCRHFSAWAWARRGATEEARRSEWRVAEVMELVIWSVIVFFVLSVCFLGGLVCVGGCWWCIIYVVEVILKQSNSNTKAARR